MNARPIERLLKLPDELVIYAAPQYRVGRFKAIIADVMSRGFRFGRDAHAGTDRGMVVISLRPGEFPPGQ